METILEPLIHSPKLPFYLHQLEDLLHDEERKRQEFYDSISEQQKVEFINGEIVMQSPVKLEHEFVSGGLYTLLRTYVTTYELGYVGHEKMLIALTRNDYEPDVCYWNSQKSEKFMRTQMKFPAPDFIAEVLSPTTENNDRTVKFEDYAAHGVQEYWIIDPLTKVVEQYVLEGTSYELRQKTDSGILKSLAVPGFQIPAAAIFEQQEHLKVLQNIMQQSQEK